MKRLSSASNPDPSGFSVLMTIYAVFKGVWLVLLLLLFLQLPNESAVVSTSLLFLVYLLSFGLQLWGWLRDDEAVFKWGFRLETIVLLLGLIPMILAGVFIWALYQGSWEFVWPLVIPYALWFLLWLAKYRAENV